MDSRSYAQRGGLRKSRLSLRLVADTLIPGSNVRVQVMRTDVRQDCSVFSNAHSEYFLYLIELFDFRSCSGHSAVKCISFKEGKGRKSQTSLILVPPFDFHSLLFNVFVIICIPSNQSVNRSIHNK